MTKWLASTCLGKRGSERFMVSHKGKMALKRPSMIETLRGKNNTGVSDV